MPISSTLAHHRAVHANAVLRGDVAAAAEAKRSLNATRLEEYIRRVVNDAPPLTNEQRNRLAAILHSGGDVA